MIKLSAPARDPYWLDLSSTAPGLRIEVRPITPVIMAMAEDEAAKIFREPGADQDPQTNARAGAALVDALVQAGVTGWEGVVGEDEQPAEVTPTNVGYLLANLPIRKAIDRAYVTPAMTVVQEKNVSANSPPGTSGTTEPDIARPAA